MVFRRFSFGRVTTRSLIVVGIGDIHGRFHRVQEWLEALEHGLGRPVDHVLAVGDVEAFADAEDHRRKAAKRALPAEFADYAAKGRPLRWPLHFIGGNNEDFSALHGHAQGRVLDAGLTYLGRSGSVRLGGLHVAFLSGICAPKQLDTPLEPPVSLAAAKRAGYFRRSEVEALSSLADVDLMLVHEWPKGLVRRRGPGDKPLRAHRFPWIGNVYTRAVVDRLQPRFLWCGHSHVPLATTLAHPGGRDTQVACLDQAARPEGALLWTEWKNRRPVAAGWGTSGRPSWRAGEPWDERLTPDASSEADDTMSPQSA
jgi:hypothetical protein